MRDIKCVAALASRFSMLPGVGKKTALRYAYAVIDMSESDVDAFCEALKDVKQNVKLCSVCGNFTEDDVCEICKARSAKQICVVAYPKDVIAVENTGAFDGAYHVLHGTLSPMNNRTPDDLNIKSLLARLNGVEEVIIATNPDVEGEATAVYLARLIKPMGVKVTRIAQGISMGSELEYADSITLTQALGRRTAL
ncbi:MAG: recombination mediator RecR [Clostridiales bacterium]|nr:recombination mediator RecR [Clostridiales bacterium]